MPDAPPLIPGPKSIAGASRARRAEKVEHGKRRAVQVAASSSAPLDPALVLAPSYVALRTQNHVEAQCTPLINLGAVRAAAQADAQAGLPAGTAGGALDRLARTDRTLVLGGRTATASLAVGADGLPLNKRVARRFVSEPVLGSVEPLFPGTVLPRSASRPGNTSPAWHTLIADLPVRSDPTSTRSFLYIEAADACIEQAVAGNGTEELLPDLRLSKRPRLVLTLHPTPRIEGVAHSSLIVDDDPWRRPRQHVPPNPVIPPDDELEEYELVDQ